MCLRFSGIARPRLGKILFGSSTIVARGLSAGLLGFLLIGSAIVQAAPLFTATVGDGQAGYPTLTNNGPTAVEATLNSSVPVGDNASDTKNQFAAAGPSGLRASARVTLSAAYSGSIPELGDASDSGRAYAKMQFDDLLVNGGNSIPTLASLNLDLSGTFLTNVNAFGGSANAQVSVRVAVTVPDAPTYHGFPNSQVFDYFQNIDTSGNMTGSLFDSGRITTQPLLFYRSLTVELFIRVAGDAGGFDTSFDAFSDSLGDFSHTVTFATSGPVFNLPDGYTVDSVEAHITDNAFVPEPASLTLLGMGIVGLLGCRSRRTKNVCQNSIA